MNEKGRQTKLLAAIAVLAMVVCVFAVVMPSTDAEQATHTNVDLAGTEAAVDGDYYFVDADTATTGPDATITAPSGTVTIIMEVGAVVNLPTVTSTTVNLYIGTWTQTAEATGGESAKGTVTYDTNTKFDLTAVTTAAVNITATAYGFTVDTPANITPGDNEVLYISDSSSGTTYVNPAMIGVQSGISDFVLGNGGSFDVPANITINGSFTVSTQTTDNGVTSTVSQMKFNVGTGSITGSVFHTTESTGKLDIENSNGQLTLNASGWDQGTMEVSEGTVTVPAGNNITGQIVNTIGNNTANDHGNDVVILYDDVDDLGTDSWIVIYSGTYSGDINVTTPASGGNGMVRLMDGANYSGTITLTQTDNGGSDVGKYTRSAEVEVKNNTDGILYLIDFSDSGFKVAGTGTTSNGVMTNSTTVVTSISSSVEAIEGTVSEKSLVVSSVALGTMVLSDRITMAGDSVIPVGSTLTFAQGGSIDLAGNDLYLLGGVSSQTTTANQQFINSTNNDDPADDSIIYTTNASSIANYLGSDVTTQSLEYTIQLGADNSSVDTELQGLPSGTVVEIKSDDSTPANNVIAISGAVSWNGLIINLTGANAITINVATGSTLSMTNVTVDDQNTSDVDARMTVAEGAAISINNTRLYLVVDVDDGASETVNNNGVRYENTSSDVKVGYGTTLTLENSVSVNTIDVYGTLVIAGNVTIPVNEAMDVHENATVTVDGTLTVQGIAKFETGSTTTINGTMNVGQANSGGAVVEIIGDVTVAAEGTLNVMPGVNGDRLSFNTLVAPVTNGDDRLEVYGTLSMRSQIFGYVHDLGTVTINGTSDNATIVVYEGVTLTVTSVTGGLTVTDEGICDETIGTNTAFMAASTGNKISMDNVTNVTVVVSVDTFNYTDAQNVNHRNFRSVMSVYGAVGAVTGTDGNVTVENVTVAPVDINASGTTASAYVMVPEGQTLTFGANVDMVVNDGLTVNGNVNFIVAVNGNDGKDISGNGTITVNGTMTVSNATLPEAAGITMNAVKYQTTDSSTSVVTYTYTGFAAALAAASGADEQTLNVLGKVTVTETADIPAGVTVMLVGDAKLTVDSGVTLTLVSGAEMNGGTDSQVIVDGTYIAQDYASNHFVTNTVSDVVRTEGAVRTWTSLYNAINVLGWTDIELTRPVVIDEDLAIPAGTTVTTNVAPVTVNNNTYSILVSGATLTVEGTLDMKSGAQGALEIVDTTSDEGEVVVTGTLIRTVLNSVTPSDLSSEVAGVYFTIKDGAYNTYYITNMANAGTIVSVTTKLDNSFGVKTYGNVSAQDASFAVAENSLGYTITIAGQSIVSMNTLTLGAGVTFTVSPAGNAVAKTMFTGTISAVDTVVNLSRASDITFVSYSVIGVETTYGLAAYGEVNGTVTVAEGTLDVGYGTDPDDKTLTVGEDSVFAVESGATLNIASGMTLTLAEDVEIAGTVVVANASGIAAQNADVTLTIAGTMDVDVNRFSTTNVVLIITGTLNVLDDNTMIVSEKMVIGAAPETLGVGGAITGSYNITGNYILAYAGADLTGAQINWNTAMNQSDAQSTVYYVNDTEYATVYANGGVDINGIFGYVGDSNRTWTEINLAGWDNLSADFVMSGSSNTYAYQWYTADGQKAAGNIGSADAVYIEFDLAQITGTISKDAGIILTIDDVIVFSDVSQSQKNYPLSVGTHTIAWSERTGYNIENVTVTFNGQAVENGGTITITANMQSFTIIADGAVPGAAPGGDSGSSTASDDGLGLTDYLLIVLVILIVVMAIMVAVRLMRS